MLSSGSRPLKSSPVTLIGSRIRILEKLEIRLTRQVLVQVVQRVVVEPETVARVERWVSWFAGGRELGRRGSWGNFRGRCRRRRRIGGLWQSLQPCIRSGDGRCGRVGDANRGFVAKPAALLIGVETGDAAGTCPPSGNVEIAARHPTAIKRLLTGTNLLVGILVQIIGYRRSRAVLRRQLFGDRIGTLRALWQLEIAEPHIALISEKRDWTAR